MLRCMLVLVGCVTTRIDPALYEQKTFALASVHARNAISFETSGVMPTLDDNELGAEVVEMSLADTEVDLARVLGVDELVPIGKALERREYNALPEAYPPEAWSQVNDMIAVDVDAPSLNGALGKLAQALHVDAVIVLRHEWALARDRYEINEGVTAYDRCTLVVVDKNGRRLWDDVAVARVPVLTLWSGPMSVGINGATWADEARQLARRTARMCMDSFHARRAENRNSIPVNSRAAGPPSAEVQP